MASVQDLMGVGVPNEVAMRIGFFVGTFEGGATLRGPGNHLIKASTSGTINLASSFAPGDKVVVMGVTACSVAPDAASLIWPTSLGVAHTVTAGVTKTFYRFSQTEWFVETSA